MKHAIHSARCSRTPYSDDKEIMAIKEMSITILCEMSQSGMQTHRRIVLPSTSIPAVRYGMHALD